MKNAEEAKEIAEQNEKLAAEAKKDEEEKQREQQKKYLEMANCSYSENDVSMQIKTILSSRVK